MRQRAGLTLFVLAAMVMCARAQTFAGEVKFEIRELAHDQNEGAAIADVNRDGKPDAVAGRFWFAAPDFVARPLRAIDDWNGYTTDNGDHIVDVDGDGWPDVVSGAFMDTKVYWWRNPGADGLAKGQLWAKSLLVDTGAVQNEMTWTRDIDGDGQADWIADSWNVKNPVQFFRLTRDGKKMLHAAKVELGPGSNGHGMGFGDLNGDGREDILDGRGWFERPAGDVTKTHWKFHPDWSIEASTPMLVYDVNHDGRNDIIVGNGHDYGLFWWEQKAPAVDGTLQWDKHLIDKSFSQPHAMILVDLDGDGQPELVTGKRHFAHNGHDPGGMEPPCLFYYTIDRKTGVFTKHTIEMGHVGTGLQIRAADFNGDGRMDLFVAGKSGTYVLINHGESDK